MYKDCVKIITPSFSPEISVKRFPRKCCLRMPELHSPKCLFHWKPSLKSHCLAYPCSQAQTEAAGSWGKIRDTQITQCNISSASTDCATSLHQLKMQRFEREALLLVLLCCCCSVVNWPKLKRKKRRTGQTRFVKNKRKKKEKKKKGRGRHCALLPSGIWILGQMWATSMWIAPSC